MKKTAILSITAIALMSTAAVFLYPTFFPVKTGELNSNKKNGTQRLLFEGHLSTRYRNR